MRVATQEQLEAAMKAAVKAGIFPETNGEDAYLKAWEGMRLALDAAIGARSIGHSWECWAIKKVDGYYLEQVYGWTDELQRARLFSWDRSAIEAAQELVEEGIHCRAVKVRIEEVEE